MRVTSLLQNTGLDNKTSAAATWQLLFGARPLRLSLVIITNFRSQFNLVGRAGPATNSLYFANADRWQQ